MTQFSDERGAELRQLFFETAQELLQSLNEDALKLEKSPQDQEIVRSIRRTVHTLKGDAAAAGFAELSQLAHALEDVLSNEAISSDVPLAEIGFAAADVFGAMLSAYSENAAAPDTTRLKTLIERAGGNKAEWTGRGEVEQKTHKPAAWTEYERLAAQAAQSEGKTVLHVVAHVDPLCAMPLAAQQLVTNELAAVAQILATRPEPGALTKSQVVELLIATSQPHSTILIKSHVPTVITQAECFEFGVSQSGEQSAPAVKETAPTAARRLPHSTPHSEKRNPIGQLSETILRVDAERIDNVLNLVGELIIGKSMLQQTLHEYSRRFPKDPLRARFADAMGFQARVLNDLQRSVMKIRMVPVDQLFRRFPRIVRDAAQRCDKQVELAVAGQDTDVDKGLLDAIAEPLTHIVRNCVSHGIESPGERDKAGKPSTGKIRLDAYHQANQLIVEVSDDGRGIDVDKVKAKGILTGVITAQDSEHMSHTEILELIFKPGFSTAEQITEISGRGVGLDVVRNVLHRLKGTVELETHLGEGTKFRLKLPLTLAIIKALMFRIEQRLYAIPLNTVAEIARAKESDVHNVDSWEVLQLRGQVLPLMRLGQRPESELGSSTRKIFILVINIVGRNVGLIVDSLEGEEELVIKALDDHTIPTDLVSGASILGDGRVVLIMNLPAVLERFTVKAATALPSGLFLTAAERRVADHQAMGARQ